MKAIHVALLAAVGYGGYLLLSKGKSSPSGKQTSEPARTVDPWDAYRPSAYMPLEDRVVEQGVLGSGDYTLRGSIRKINAQGLSAYAPKSLLQSFARGERPPTATVVYVNESKYPKTVSELVARGFSSVIV